MCMWFDVRVDVCGLDDKYGLHLEQTGAFVPFYLHS